MRLWFEGGAGGSGNAPGDGGETPPAVDAPESSSGAEAEPTPERSAADTARDEYIAKLVADGIEKGVKAAVSQLQGATPAAPAATPPTTGRGVAGELQAEAEAINAETARLEAAFRANGYTAENIAADNALTRRLSNFNARLLAQGMSMQEAERQTDKAAAGDDPAKARAWRQFAAQNPNIPTDFARAKFEQDYAAAHPAEPARTKPDPASPARTVNVSGAGGSPPAAEKKRVVTQSTYDRELAEAEEKGDFETVTKLGRARRSGALLVKG